MTNLSHVTVGLLALIAANAASANVQIKFVESAPKDRFVITNSGECDLSNITLDIDLANSVGKLYFDTTANGAGVEVFQPFETNNSNVQLTSAPNVRDGDQRLSVLIDKLPMAGSVSFTIDVDDALENSSLGQIRVTGGEFEGAQATLSTGSIQGREASFSAENMASVVISSCP